MADAKRLMALSMVTPLAKEVASQITLGAGNRDRLMALSMPTDLADELAAQITGGAANVRELVALSMVPKLAREVASQIGGEGAELVTPEVLESVAITAGELGGTHTWDAETLTASTTVVGTSFSHPRYIFTLGALNPDRSYSVNITATDANARLYRASISVAITDPAGSAAFVDSAISAQLTPSAGSTNLAIALNGTILGDVIFSEISVKEIIGS